MPRKSGGRIASMASALVSLVPKVTTATTGGWVYHAGVLQLVWEPGLLGKAAWVGHRLLCPLQGELSKACAIENMAKNSL